MKRRVQFTELPSRCTVAIALAALLSTAAVAQAPLPPVPMPPPMPPEAANSATASISPAAAAALGACASCGKVEAIDERVASEQWTPLGTGVSVGGAPPASPITPAQGVASFRIGSDLSNQGMVMLGAVGGASYTATPKGYNRPRWDVTVRLDSGALRVVSLSYEPYIREGDRVRVIGNQIELLDQ